MLCTRSVMSTWMFFKPMGWSEGITLCLSIYLLMLSLLLLHCTKRLRWPISVDDRPSLFHCHSMSITSILDLLLGQYVSNSYRPYFLIYIWHPHIEYMYSSLATNLPLLKATHENFAIPRRKLDAFFAKKETFLTQKYCRLVVYVI